MKEFFFLNPKGLGFLLFLGWVFLEKVLGHAGHVETIYSGERQSERLNDNSSLKVITNEQTHFQIKRCQFGKIH